MSPHQRGDLESNRRTKHREDKVYVCEADTCAKEYRRRDARLKHYRKQHPELAASPLVRRSFKSTNEEQSPHPSPVATERPTSVSHLDIVDLNDPYHRLPTGTTPPRSPQEDTSSEPVWSPYNQPPKLLDGDLLPSLNHEGIALNRERPSYHPAEAHELTPLDYTQRPQKALSGYEHFGSLQPSRADLEPSSTNGGFQQSPPPPLPPPRVLSQPRKPSDRDDWAAAAQAIRDNTVPAQKSVLPAVLETPRPTTDPMSITPNTFTFGSASPEQDSGKRLLQQSNPRQVLPSIAEVHRFIQNPQTSRESTNWGGIGPRDLPALTLPAREPYYD